MARTELDLDHITAVCDRLTQTRVAVGLTITPTLRGYAIDTRSVAGARRVQTAFTQLGYRANLPERIGRRDHVTLTGWNRPALETRTTALQQAVAWLSDSRDRTAADAIDNGIRSRGELYDALRATVEQSTGIITNPMTTLTGDHDCARLLETAHRLERDVTAHIHRHVQAAEIAVHLYRQHRPGMPEDQARAYAITTACTHGSPPNWANGPNHGAPADLSQRQEIPAQTAEASEVSGDHPAAIAAHDHIDGAYAVGARAESIPADAPPPPAISANQQGPARGPATR